MTVAEEELNVDAMASTSAYAMGKVSLTWVLSERAAPFAQEVSPVGHFRTALPARMKSP